MIHMAGDPRAGLLEAALNAEVQAIGLHQSVELSVAPDPLPGAPTIAVFLGSIPAAADGACGAAVNAALADVITVLPVVEDLNNYADFVPGALGPVNGLEWSGPAPEVRVGRRVLEQLGIEDRQRRVFISHRRADGLLAAEYLADYLSHHGFRPFIDRFNVPPGVDVQERIADELEDYAFLLVLETPLAHESDWVFDEVDYALTHLMGLHIVRWPGDFDSIPATARLPRQQLTPVEVVADGHYDVLVPAALDRVLVEVEASHAYSMVRRRRHLLRSVEDAAEVAGYACTPLGDSRLLVEQPGRRDVVQIAPRLPDAQDLYDLDSSRAGPGAEGGVLVHATRRITSRRQSLLTWVANGRPLTMIPEHGIGGYW